MVKIDIGKKPGLTYEILLDILGKNLSYKVEKWKLLGDGISIWKNSLIGAIVKLEQKSETTILSVEVNPPSVIIRVISCIFTLGCFLASLFISSGGFVKKVAKEIKEIPNFR